MSLRAKILTYFIALHALLAAVAAFVIAQNPILLFGVEAVFVLSVILSWRLVRALFVPLDLIRTGAELINERDFTSRFVAVGQPEMDMLIRVYNDMIDRLRTERLVAEEQSQLLAKLVQASPSGIVICGFDGEVVQTNPAADRLGACTLLPELMTLNAGESRLVTGDGARRLKVWRAEFRDRGFPKSFFLIDELTEELRLSEKAAYEKLIRMMSHEVGNSVGAVRSLLESSLRYAPQIGEADREDFTNALTIASQRMLALDRFMRGFADVVRIPPPHREPTRIADVIRHIAALLQPEVESRHIALTLALDDTQASVDRNQLEQVILNVLRNAIDAADDDGAIDVTLNAGTLTVADSGPGLDESVRSDLFTPFFTTKRNGRGLGLTIVQEILANHALPFSLENREGGGAEFRVRFQV